MMKLFVLAALLVAVVSSPISRDEEAQLTELLTELRDLDESSDEKNGIKRESPQSTNGEDILGGYKYTQVEPERGSHSGHGADGYKFPDSGTGRHQRFFSALIQLIMSLGGPVSDKDIEQAKKTLENGAKASRKMFGAGVDVLEKFIKNPKDYKQLMKGGADLMKQFEKLDLKAFISASEVIFRGIFKGVEGGEKCGFLGKTIKNLKKANPKVDLKSKAKELIEALRKDKACILKLHSAAEDALKAIGKEKSATENQKGFGIMLAVCSHLNRELTNLTVTSYKLFFELIRPSRAGIAAVTRPPLQQQQSKRAHLTARELLEALDLAEVLKKEDIV